MALKMNRIQVWTCEIPDRPGTAAGKLALLNRAGAELAFILTRPVTGHPDVTALFVAPIQGAEQIEAAEKAGLEPSRKLAMLCVEGRNRSGISYDIMSRIAVAGINLRGISISAIGDQFIAYLAVDDLDTVTQVIQILVGLDD